MYNTINILNSQELNLRGEFMLANENTTVEVVFTEEAGKRTAYDCSTPVNCFAVFLEKFLEEHKAGRLQTQDPKAVQTVLGLLDEDCYLAGKEAFLFIRRTNCLGFNFKRVK